MKGFWDRSGPSGTLLGLRVVAEPLINATPKLNYIDQSLVVVSGFHGFTGWLGDIWNELQFSCYNCPQITPNMWRSDELTMIFGSVTKTARLSNVFGGNDHQLLRQ